MDPSPNGSPLASHLAKVLTTRDAVAMSSLLLQGGLVFDGTGSPATVADVVFVDGRVSAAGPNLDSAAFGPDQIVDCVGKTVIPGLIDCHVHFMVDGNFSAAAHGQTPFSYNFYAAAERMKRTLDVGITTVREAGGSDLGVKEAQERGLIAGPRMQIAITILSQTGGHGDSWEVCGAHMPGLLDCHPGRPSNIVDGPEEMRKKVRQLVRAGADVIKVCTSGGVISPRDDPRHAHFRDEELEVLVAEASAAHLFVMSHAQANEGIKSAIRTGIRSIEHGIYLDDLAIQMMLDNGTYLVPTLVAPQGVLDAADAGIDVPAYAIEKTKQVIDVHRESITKAIKAGVKIAMGTDAGVVPHGTNLRELALMAELGMTDAEVLRSATGLAAELMGLEEDLGSLTVGRRADAVVLEGESLDVSDLRSRLRGVYQDGVPVSPTNPYPN